MLVWAAKDPDEIVKRNIDWSDHASWRDGDKISSATFNLSTAAGMTTLTSDDYTHDGHEISIVTLSGGTEGLRGKVLGEVVTEDGQTLQTTATILLKAR